MSEPREATDSGVAAVEAMPAESTPREGLWSDDSLAIITGLCLLLCAFVSVERLETPDAGLVAQLGTQIAKVGSWTNSPLDAVAGKWLGLSGVLALGLVFFGAASLPNKNRILASRVDYAVYACAMIAFLVVLKFFNQSENWLLYTVCSLVAVMMRRTSFRKFAVAFLAVFILALFANLMASQSVVKHYGLSYALWALVLGLLISNTIGVPDWLKPAVKTELFIKTGLVLLGAEVLLPKLLALGLPGIFVAWVVTPIVLITTYWFGQKVLGIKSKSLNMVIAADMSVCGVSAAIATSAACKAKKEELSLAVAMSLMFTVVMMVVMPGIIRAIGMDPILGGAWMGGTIDSTGAVAAAGEFLGDDALYVATTVKMIQNILIGVTALCVAIYWTTVVEREEGSARVGWGEIWKRFPKFVVGFVIASVVFSIAYAVLADGPAVVKATTGVTKTFRGWWFCLAFVSIGLESNFREFAKTLSGGKPLLLYLCGQTLNLCLTLAMGWLMFRVIFREWVDTALAG